MSAGLLSAAAVVSLTGKAFALGPLDLEIGAKAGIGTMPSNSSSDYPNPLNFGIGARAGVSIVGIYGGGSIIYYLGDGKDMPVGHVSANTLMYGVEGGYGIKLINLLTLRAQVGVGSYKVTVSSPGGSSDHSDLYIEPGVTALITLPLLGWFVGADANALVLTGMKDQNGNSATDLSFTLHGQVGYTF